MSSAQGQSITTGDESITGQAGRDLTQNITVHSGISEERARVIAHEISLSTGRDLVEAAKAKYEERTSALIQQALRQIAEEAPQARDTFADPDMQFALAAAQEEFGRSGEPELGDILVELLVRRAESNGEPRQRIVLNDAITTARQLVLADYNLLSLIFLVRHLRVPRPFDVFARRLIMGMELLHNSDVGDNIFRHLQYAGCIMRDEQGNAYGHQFESAFLNEGGRYYTQKGLTPQQVAQSGLPAFVFEPHPFAVGVQQLAFANQAQIDAQLDTTAASSARQLLSEQTFALNHVGPELDRLVRGTGAMIAAWNASALPIFSLTSVGCAIAISNLKRCYQLKIDLQPFVS